MAKAKNYNNFVEVVGNVAKIYQNPSNNKAGDMRLTLGVHHNYTKKNSEKVTETEFLNVLVKNGRKYAKQESVTTGAFLRVLGHLENNSYKNANGEVKGGMEINADKIVVLKKREDGTVENTETGEVETVDETIELENA